MTRITKALIIDQPWIDLILSGRKTWEMRGTGTSHRGPFGLIRKGSGQVVGVARLTGCGTALSVPDMVASIDRHHIPEQTIRSGFVSKWTTPWHLAEARPLANPVPYRHPSGAVTWVNLAPEVTEAIAAQLGAQPAAPAAVTEPRRAEIDPGTLLALTRVPIIPRRPREAAVQTSIQPAAQPAAMPAAAIPGSPRTLALLGETEITAGNLKNNHFYLRSFLHRFPDALVGGRDLPTPILATVEAEGMAPAQMDICPRHRFFRDRSWTRRFFESQDAAPGDRLRVSEIAPLRYHVSLVKG